jgi:hypothetical protein
VTLTKHPVDGDGSAANMAAAKSSPEHADGRLLLAVLITIVYLSAVISAWFDGC